MAEHATLAALLDRVSAADLAEVAAPDDPSVDGALLAEAAADAYGMARTADERAAGDKALARVNREIAETNALCDGYLVRYPEAGTTAALGTYALDILEWRLLGGERDSGRWERRRAALAWLRDIADGKIDLLVPADSSSAVTNGDVLFDQPEPVYSDRALRGYFDPSRGGRTPA